MARFDPWTYPDRLGFEAFARRTRNEELGRMADAAGAWLERVARGFAIRYGRFATAAFAHTHRHSPR